jgi:ligand-binding SRPBCC domain-containing protein
MEHPPKVLVSASAIGYYGDRGEAILDEQEKSGSGFLAEVCRGWEDATSPVQGRGIRVINVRIGMVLSADGGALPKIVMPFRLGAGGPLGDGRQYMSWITLTDLCRVVNHVLVTESLKGPVNAVSPSPITNREFTSALAAVLCRPALMPAPRFAVRLALGELADALLFASARVIPTKLLNSGFRFQDSDLSLALGRNVGTVSTLSKSQWIARPPHEVFPFFADASNLESITPPWLKFKILNPGVRVCRGAFIEYRLHLHGIPLRWRSEIIEWDPPYRFVDVQRRGPYSLWIHEHRFEPHDGGTLVQDTVQYAAPGGTLLRVLLIDRALHSIFSYMRERLEEHLA